MVCMNSPTGSERYSFVQTKTLIDRTQAVALDLGESQNTNSKSALTARLQLGQLTRVGPLLLVVGRSAFMITAQAVAVCWLWIRFHTWSWNGAAKWWTVYGTLVDLGCLALMSAFLRKEGVRLRDLIGRVR